MLCHLSLNRVFAMVSPLLTGADRESYWVVCVVVVTLMVSALLFTTRGRLGVKTEPRQSIAAEPGAPKIS